MATTVAVLEAALHADTKAFDRAMGKSESKMQKLGKVAGVAGLAIAAGLAVAFKVGFDEMVASQKVMGQTEAVIKSTGGVANVTAEHVDELAQSMLELSGVDDELIAAGENVLLTFRNIRNEAGKGNDIFDQATKATLDFSTAMGLDMNQAALQVGKALNDPVKGMTKLQRQGVTFTASQEKLIKKLVASGDVMGAQKVILKELTTEFGGSAKAAGDTLPAKLNKAREAFADVAAVLVEELLPAFEFVAEKLTEMIGYLKEHPGVAKAVIIGLGILAGALIAASVAATLLNLALLANPVGLVVIGIIALIALLVVLYKKFELVRQIVGFVTDNWRRLILLIPVLGPVLFIIVNHFKTLRRVAEAVLGAIRDAFNKVKTAALAVKDFITGTLWPLIAPKLRSVKNLVTDIADAFQTVIGKVSTLIGWISDLIGWISKIPSIGMSGTTGVPGRGRPYDNPNNASGTSSSSGRWGWVGERGPELVRLPRGSSVYTAGQSAAMASGGGGGVTFNNYGFIGTSEREFMRWLDRAQEKRGRRGG